MPKSPPTGGVRLQEVSVSGGSTVHFPMKPRQSVGMLLSILHSVPQCHVCTNQFMEMER